MGAVHSPPPLRGACPVEDPVFIFPLFTGERGLRELRNGAYTPLVANALRITTVPVPV
ncbi:MAG: hypothetical protein NTZ78_08805 [Candidatus Aureabacteria bacterium]|nr:hypothetical protein [Candidatus Auribacterota bacterium]